MHVCVCTYGTEERVEKQTHSRAGLDKPWPGGQSSRPLDFKFYWNTAMLSKVTVLGVVSHGETF